MSKIRAIRNREPYRREDGAQMCFSHESGAMSIYQPCQLQQAAAPGGQGWGLIFFIVLLLAVAITWGGSEISRRQSLYQSLFTLARRNLS